MFNYYKFKDEYLFSYKKDYNYKQIDASAALSNCKVLYYLNELDPIISKKTFSVSDPSILFLEKEGLELLDKNSLDYNIPKEIEQMIDAGKVKCINTLYPNYVESIQLDEKVKKKVNILALGDVGSTLLLGLHLLGSTCIDTIGIYDRSSDKIKRFEYEMNQTMIPFKNNAFPNVKGITKDELFNCDMFVFCASKGVPPINSKIKDVRMIQFNENAKIIKEYALMARKLNFKGIFSVVSDPVDPLCKTVLLESNKNDNGEYDFKGLAPEQIKGYGLGVMNARASYYAKCENKYSHYLNEGRAFGPHGEDLIIADSINNYNDKLSKELTKLAVNANMDVRATGFKPFIAPALSSGAISIILTLRGEWHYSSNFLGGVYMGAKNRNTTTGLEFERINIPKPLYARLEKTYNMLKTIN